jgi:predicted acyltransferase
MSDAIIEQASPSKSSRLISLDVVRGISIAFMILVNDNGSERYAYWPLKHAAWSGWTPTDLVFPSFLFLVGVSIVLSTDSRRARGESRKTLLLHAVRRAVILFLLGLVVNGFPYFPLDTLRIYGVLQRIAICYLLASILYLFTGRRAAVLAGVTVAALFCYWVLMRWVPVPGFGVPTHEIPLLDKDNNWVAYLDRKIFPGRLYEGVRDPEGLLSNIPSLATALLGVLTGLWLTARDSLQKKAAWLLAAAACALALGEFWGLWFPINKKLWTSSYVLFSAGATLLALAVCYFLVEVKQWKRAWTFPWIVFGSNAIVAYVFSELLASTLSNMRVEHAGQIVNLRSLIYDGVFSSIVNPSFGSLLYSLAYVAVCFVPVVILYRKQIFLRI